MSENELRETEQAILTAGELGKTLASLDNKELSTGVVGKFDLTRKLACLDRLDAFFDICGLEAMQAFWAGYEQTMDLSINSKWRTR